MEVRGKLHAPGAIPPEKKTHTHLIVGWMSYRAVLDVLKKRSLTPVEIRTSDRPARNIGAILNGE
jgi:hypothetical protein